MTIRYLSAVSIAAICAASLVLSGCAKGNTGASAKPTITIKPAETKVAGSDSEKPGTQKQEVAAGYGTLKGVVKFQGAAPNAAVIVAKGTAAKDGQVCAAKFDIKSESVVVGADGGLANVFIYLDKVPAGAKNPPLDTSPLLFDQRGCVFLPHAMIVRTKQDFRVVSADALSHNTRTSPVRNSPFNSLIGPNDRVGIPLIYDKAETKPITVGCDIHTWMRAYHLPLDHPYGAVTKADGSFEIPDLPSGKHSFRIWHENAGGKGDFLNRGYEVTIEPDKSTEADLSFSAKDFGL